MHYNKRCSITHSHSTLLLSSRISLSLSPPSLSFNARHSLAIYFRDRHHIAWSISPSTVRPYVLPRLSTRSLGNPLPLPSASLPPVSLPLLCLFLLFHCHCPRMSERAGRAWEIHQIARMSKRIVPLVLVRARPSHYSRVSLLASAAMVIGHCGGDHHGDLGLLFSLHLASPPQSIRVIRLSAKERTSARPRWSGKF